MDEDEWAAVSQSIVERKEERARLLRGHENLAAEIESLLFRHDPIGLNYATNTDEYRPEAETITLRLPMTHDADDALRVVHEEFVRWFGQPTAGPIDRYREISAEIWKIWSSHA